MEYKEALRLFEEVLETTLDRMRQEGCSEQEVQKVKDAFNKVRNG